MFRSVVRRPLPPPPFPDPAVVHLFWSVEPAFIVHLRLGNHRASSGRPGSPPDLPPVSRRRPPPPAGTPPQQLQRRPLQRHRRSRPLPPPLQQSPGLQPRQRDAQGGLRPQQHSPPCPTPGPPMSDPPRNRPLRPPPHKTLPGDPLNHLPRSLQSRRGGHSRHPPLLGQGDCRLHRRPQRTGLRPRVRHRSGGASPRQTGGGSRESPQSARGQQRAGGSAVVGALCHRTHRRFCWAHAC
mmetsp:Transcript_31159/g.71242  ORF Transcript_31159/g.71242 Transcript_31159/m.71242 type:complete len:239 (+) Transcript_31159:686-1402(+)